MRRLRGKVAIVTGGASGMGLATVERFVEEGARVVFADLAPGVHPAMEDRLGPAARLHYRDREVGGSHDGHAIAARVGADARFVPADVTVASELERVFDETLATFGGIDVVVNNAGVGAPEGGVAECPEYLFDRVIDVDLKAVWRGIQLAAPHLVARGGGSIISMASVAGLRGVPGMGSYSAAKGGVIALTRVAAIELAPERIRVNCVCPGGIVTPIIHDSPASGVSVDPDVVRQAMSDAQPWPRAGEPEDIAALAAFLAADESSFVTGQVLAVDGGLTAEADARSRHQDVAATLGVE